MKLEDMHHLLKIYEQLDDNITATDAAILKRKDWDAKTRAKIEGSRAGMLFAWKEIAALDTNESGEPWIYHGSILLKTKIEELLQLVAACPPHG